MDLTRDSSKLAGREVRIVQTRQEEEEEEEVKKFLEPKSSICGQNRHADEEGKEKLTSLQRDSKDRGHRAHGPHDGFGRLCIGLHRNEVSLSQVVQAVRACI